ncbi:hypothetical protein P9X10_01235 [Bacillus cereus]|nr:hypothetical protein [Bacillus cereus]
MKYIDLDDNFYSFQPWDKLFDSEEELIKLAKKVDILKYRARSCAFAGKLVTIQSKLKTNEFLDDASLKELKDIAGEIYKYYNIDRVNYF